MSNGGISLADRCNGVPLFAGLAPTIADRRCAVSGESPTTPVYIIQRISRSGHAGWNPSRKLAAELKYPRVSAHLPRTRPYRAMAGGHFSRGKNSPIWHVVRQPAPDAGAEDRLPRDASHLCHSVVRIDVTDQIASFLNRSHAAVSGIDSILTPADRMPAWICAGHRRPNRIEVRYRTRHGQHGCI